MDITLVDPQGDIRQADFSESVSCSDISSQPPTYFGNAFNSSNALPMVLHGHHHATLTLLKELGTDSLLTSHPSVNLEFVADTQNPIGFTPAPAPSPLHTLLGLLFFKGIQFKDRWSLIKRLEQLWEGDLELPRDLDNQHVNEWLATLGQSEQARRNIWQPLCQLFLSTASGHSSAQYFQRTLAQFFLSARQNVQTFIPPYDETTVLLQPLRAMLAMQNNITWQTECTASSFQYNSEGIAGVRLSDGTTLTADIYISALPRKTFVSCLPERLLAKFSYFSNLTQLTEVPALIVHLEIPHTTTRSRLLLFTNAFQWIALRPQSTGPTNTTLISVVATDNQQLLEKPDQQILLDLLSYLPSPFGKQNHKTLSNRIIRTPHALLSCKPTISSFRPLQTSPLPNFFVAGPWTDTSLPASRESSIVSGNMCAQAVINSRSTH